MSGESEDYEDLFENAPCGLVCALGNGRITRINRTFSAWTGHQQDRIIGLRLPDLLTFAGKIYHETHIAPLLRIQGFFNEIALDFVRADGVVLPALVNAVEHRDASGNPNSLRLAVFKAPDRRRYERELLEARRAAEQAHAEFRGSEARVRELQAQLLHVSRLSAAGEMAATLAHELNQPLTAVTSAVWAALSILQASPSGSEPDVPAAAELREALDIASEQALRAGKIVRSMRDFVTRRRSADRQFEDVAKLAEAAGTLALVDARERGVHVSFRFGPRLPPVRVDRVQIHQVLFNLMRNALEAMAQSDQGTGTVRPPRGRHELIVTAAADEPGMVDVAIADTGPGLTPEMADHLFSPFVSTKPDGVGLGLSICRSIIEAHGGRLWVEPNQGRGAVFRFTLPAESSGEDG